MFLVTLPFETLHFTANPIYGNIAPTKIAKTTNDRENSPGQAIQRWVGEVAELWEILMEDWRRTGVTRNPSQLKVSTKYQPGVDSRPIVLQNLPFIFYRANWC